MGNYYDKYHVIDVTLTSGTMFIVKVKSRDLPQFMDWISKANGVAEYLEVKSITPQKPHPVSSNPSKMTAARLAAGLTQVELAERIGVSRQNIQRWETGTNRPRTESLIRVGNELGVDWTTLIDD